MRSDRFNKPTRSTSENLAKTCYTAMVIGGVITFAGMFFPLQQHQGADVTDLLGYYLPWCLAYGIPCLAIAIYGVFGITLLKNYPFLQNSSGIAGIISGSLIVIGSLPLAIVFQAWEFFISLLVIGGCILAIGILELTALKNKE